MVAERWLTAMFAGFGFSGDQALKQRHLKGNKTGKTFGMTWTVTGVGGVSSPSIWVGTGGAESILAERI